MEGKWRTEWIANGGVNGEGNEGEWKANGGRKGRRTERKANGRVM